MCSSWPVVCCLETSRGTSLFTDSLQTGVIHDGDALLLCDRYIAPDVGAHQPLSTGAPLLPSQRSVHLRTHPVSVCAFRCEAAGSRHQGERFEGTLVHVSRRSLLPVFSFSSAVVHHVSRILFRTHTQTYPGTRLRVIFTDPCASFI
jgi:hypothetical protein